MHPGAPFIKRNGEVNAWDNADFKAAVKAAGKKQIILAGITTDVSTETHAIYMLSRALRFSSAGLHDLPRIVPKG